MERWPPQQSSPPHPRHGSSPMSPQGYFELGQIDPSQRTRVPNSPPREPPSSPPKRPSPSQMYNSSYGQSSASPSLSSLGGPSPGGPSPEITYQPYNPYITSRTPLVSTVPARKSVGSAASIYTTSSKGVRRSDTQTENLVRQRSRMTAQWKIHYYMPSAMVLLFFLGIFGAVAHHLYYKSLHGKPAENQLTKVRFGTAFAFWTKAMLVGASVIAYRQRIWQTLRQKALTLGAIDSLFAAVEDPTMFASWEMIRNSKLSTLMALVCWFIPIAAVLSPASLTSNVELATNITQCEAAPTLNFTREGDYDFRRQDDFPGFVLSFYNSTQEKNLQGNYDPIDENERKAQGIFDYFDQPSKIVEKLSTLTALLKKPVSADDAQQNICGIGWNCTYTIQFKGPGYSCLEVADASESPTSVIAPDGAPFNTSILAPLGKFVYYADVNFGDYVRPQPGFDSNTTAGFPADIGIFKTEPVLWIGHVINTTKPIDPKSTLAKNWDFDLVAKIFKCTHQEFNYTVHMNYTEGVQSSVVEGKADHQLIQTTPIPTFPDDPDKTNYTIPADQTKFEIVPVNDRAKYQIFSAYHALGARLRYYLNGNLEHRGLFPATNTLLSETKLVDQRTGWAIDDLMNGTQSLYEDMIVTLLSEPHLIAALNQSTTCVKTRYVNLFTYHAQGLWIGYAIVVAAAACCVIIGGLAIRENGVSSDTMFSRIMVTTRNPTLDKLSVGACLGGDPFPKVLKRVKLRFGVLDEYNVGGGGEDGSSEEARQLYGTLVEHCAFGTEGETKMIEKNRLYAGLRRYREEFVLDDEGVDDDDDEGSEEAVDESTALLREKEEEYHDDEPPRRRRRRFSL